MPKRKSREARPRWLDRFLKTSLLGILLFAVLQAVFGNLVSDWVKQRFASPELRVRYLLLDIERPGLIPGSSYPLQDDTLAKLFGDSSVYVQRNIVLDRASSIATDLLRPDNIGEASFATIADYTKNLYPSDSVLRSDVGTAAGETMWMLSVIPANRQLLRRGVLVAPTARRLAQDNPHLKDAFYCLLDDSRHKCVTLETPDHYYIEKVYPPKFKLLVLDVENISSVHARSVWFEGRSYRTDGTFRLHDSLPADSESGSRVSLDFPVSTLTENEHVLIPLLILAERARHWGWADPVRPEFRLQLLNSVEFGGGENASTAQHFSLQGSVGDYFRYLGPSLAIDLVHASGEHFEVRPFSFDNLTYAMVSGGGVGSCPLLVIKSASAGAWIEVGNVLVGARGKENERRDFVRLRDFGGALKLREVEDEVTYLDYLAVQEAESASDILCVSDQVALSAADGSYAVMNRGDELQMHCETAGRPEVVVIVEGFYEPASSLNDRRDSGDLTTPAGSSGRHSSR